MKIFVLMFIVSTLLFSKVYYSKVEPYKIKNIASNVNGQVIFIDEDKIGMILSESPYIKIDSVLDQEELKYTKEKLLNIIKTISLDEVMAKNLDDSLNKKRVNYEKVKSLKIKSSVEKDREFYDLIASENAYISIKKEINSLKRQMYDLKLRKVQLEKTINDKILKDTNYTLYSINVKVGQVVAKSTPLATVADTSKAILTIYLDDDEIIDAKNKIIYINGKKTSYKITRILNIADSKNISKYMAQIVIKAPKIFSKLVKIELKVK